MRLITQFVTNKRPALLVWNLCFTWTTNACQFGAEISAVTMKWPTLLRRYSLGIFFSRLVHRCYSPFGTEMDYWQQNFVICNSLLYGTGFEGMEKLWRADEIWHHEGLLEKYSLSCNKVFMIKEGIEKTWGLVPCDRVTSPEEKSGEDIGEGKAQLQ